MAGEYKKIDKTFVIVLGSKILSSEKIDKNKNHYIDYPFDDFLKRIDYEGKVKKSGNNYRSIEEHLNIVAPSKWFFKVTGVDYNRAYRIKLIIK